MRERNITLDYFKILLSILVVMIHLPGLLYIPGVSYRIMEGNFLFLVKTFILLGITKIAVPLFFIINGYFLDFDNPSKIKSYLLKMVKLYIVWTLFYIPFMVENYTSDTYLAYLSMGFLHLWYIPGLIGAVFVISFLYKRLKNKTVLLTLALLLFVLGYCIQQFIQETNPDSQTHLFLYRNFIFVGIPFVLLGQFIKNFDFYKYKKKILILAIACFAVFFVETFMYARQYGNSPNIYLSLFIICPLLMIVVLQHSKMKLLVNDDIGHLSSAIYFIHPAVLYMTTIHTTVILKLPFVVIVSIFASFAIIQANKSLKIFL